MRGLLASIVIFAVYLYSNSELDSADLVTSLQSNGDNWYQKITNKIVFILTLVFLIFFIIVGK